MSLAETAINTFLDRKLARPGYRAAKDTIPLLSQDGVTGPLRWSWVTL